MPFGLMSARFTSMLSLIAAMLMTVDAAFATESGIDSSTVTVKVTGYGAGVSEARADAVRQAMQRVLPQLVVSDVEVNQDEVLRDRVMSTMNGFVDKVEEHSVRREGDEIVISSSITVSTKRMTNFLGLQSSTTLEIDGLSLFSELNRESEQREVVAEILARTFRGFPSETIETKVTSIKPEADNPDEFIIEFTAGFRKEWIRSLEDTLKALAVASYAFNQIPGVSTGGSTEGYGDAGYLYQAPAYVDIHEPGESIAEQRLKSEFRLKVAKNSSTRFSFLQQPICIVSFIEIKTNCYVLPRGNYEKWLAPIGRNWGQANSSKCGSLDNSGEIRYIVVPMNANGESTLVGDWKTFPNVQQRCGFWRLTLFKSNYKPYEATSNQLSIDHIHADKIFHGGYNALTLHRKMFNLAETKKIVVLPVYAPVGGGGYYSDAIYKIPATVEGLLRAARESALQK